MPYTVNWEPDGVYCKFSGAVTAAEVQSLVDEVVKDARFDSARYRITDCLEVSHPDLSADDLDQVLALDDAYSFANARPYEAALATDDTVLALLRQWASTNPNHQQLCIFSTEKDLRKWLLNPEML